MIYNTLQKWLQKFFTVTSVDVHRVVFANELVSLREQLDRVHTPR